MAYADFKNVALVADDDEFFRMALSAVLKQRLGFTKVIETASFDEAIEELEKVGGVALALFDLSMPGIECPSALRTIRDSFEVERLAVVSASKQRRDILLSLEAGAHGFVSKDQGVGELETALRRILEGGMYVPRILADLEACASGEAGQARGGRPQLKATQLTPRQGDVLELVVQGKSNKEIARALNLGPGTIKVHLAALFRSLGVANRAAAAVAGARLLERLPTSSGESPA
ncbi:MAG TPA: response regulator transcription factor [Aestuariivirgaceae bacterium]|nr:response regulator transcription factor [Aestuariivirgaceae bacterium]